MEMRLDSKVVDGVKEAITSNVGNQITVREYNKQHKLLHERIGTIVQAYGSVFQVAVSVREGCTLNRSYSYADLSTPLYEYMLAGTEVTASQQLEEKVL